MNLITDPWIPTLDTDGARHIIAPWQIANRAWVRFDWPRADLNIACLELLIGLVFLADPPADAEDWDARQPPDPDRLRTRLEPFAPAFNLTGDGPRFMQDLAPLEGKPNPPDMLFIDSAGGQTVKNNADLMVWRDRYPALDPALAAMALYTLQAFAPSGGAGNRTSMRGGGPMVTLIQPEGGSLWDTIWANVPDGVPGAPGDLPWVRATVTSDKGAKVYPEQSHPVEALFGMPRRLRLVEDEGQITGVIQRPYGTNYAGWDHPLTPYYRQKLTTEWLPKHPRAGLFGYPNWLGTVIAQDWDDGVTRRAQTLRSWPERSNHRPARVIVAGWSLDNMKPRDFVFSVPPLLDLSPAQAEAVAGMVEAADLYSLALRRALAPVLSEGEAREALREAFFAETQAAFEHAVTSGPGDSTAQGWLEAMRQVALDLFEARALPGLAEREARQQREIVQAHRNLAGAFHGYGAYGSKAYAQLGLPVPARKKETAA